MPNRKTKRHNPLKRLSAQDREDARDLVRIKKILRSPRDGKTISESRVLKELGLR